MDEVEQNDQGPKMKTRRFCSGSSLQLHHPGLWYWLQVESKIKSQVQHMEWT